MWDPPPKCVCVKVELLMAVWVSVEHEWSPVHHWILFPAATVQVISQDCCYKSADMDLSGWRSWRRRRRGRGWWMQMYCLCVEAHSFSHDLLFFFFWPMGREKSASMINGHDYLLWKCGFLDQQLHFYDLNPRQNVSSWKLSGTRTTKTTQTAGGHVSTPTTDHFTVSSRTRSEASSKSQVVGSYQCPGLSLWTQSVLSQDTKKMWVNSD